MRFLYTMHMPSSQGSLVHQISGEYPVDTVEEMCDVLNDNAFITVRQYYKDDKLGPHGEVVWVDVGQIILNTEHIGKVQEYIERKNYDRTYGNSRSSRENIERSVPSVRPRRGVF